MNEQKKRRAEKILADGWKRYVLLHGGLGWGLFVATVTAVGKAVDRSGYNLANIEWARFLLDWLTGIPIFFIAGCLWGLLMWSLMFGSKEAAEKQKID